MIVGIVLILLSIAAGARYLVDRQEKIPEEKITGTGVVEQVLTKDGATSYVIRFTGEKNKSYLAKTPGYTGNTEKYEDGKFVHIRYWFGKKTPGAEILDEELTAVSKAGQSKIWLVASILQLIVGILLIVL